MSPPLVQPWWGQPFQKVGKFLRSRSRFGFKLFGKKIVNIVIRFIKVFLPIHRLSLGSCVSDGWRISKLMKSSSSYSPLCPYQCEGFNDLVAEYTPGAGAGIQSRSKASLKQLFYEFDLNLQSVQARLHKV